MMEKVDQSKIELSPQEVPNSQGLKDYVSDCFRKNESKEKQEDHQYGTGSNPQEMFY